MSENARGGRRRQRVTRNHSRKTQCPSETVASYEGPEPRDMIGEGVEDTKERKKLTRVVDAMFETGKTCAEGERNVDKKVVVR